MFYHFTSRLHMVHIQAAGLIRTTESNVGSPDPRHTPHGQHVGPDVVWLLDTPEAAFDHGLRGSAVDKTAVYVAVDVPAIRWLDWGPAAAMDPRWRRTLIERGGGPTAAERWFVWPASIPRVRWVNVHGFTAEEVSK